RSVGGNRDDLVHRLAAARVVLAHAVDRPPVGGHLEVGVAKRARLRRLRCDRLLAAVDAPVLVVREEQRLAVRAVGAAAVLLDTRARAEARADRLGALAAVRARAHDDLAAALRGPRLE